MRRGYYVVIYDNKTASKSCFTLRSRYAIYKKMMRLTNNNHRISNEAVDWCNMSSVGNIYEFNEGKIEVKCTR